MTRSSVEADEVALEAWRSTIPYIYIAIENDDLVIIDHLTAFQKTIHLTKWVYQGADEVYYSGRKRRFSRKY